LLYGIVGLICGLSRSLYAGETTPVADPTQINARLDALFGSHRPYEQFFDKLKAATLSRTWSEVGPLLAYPMVVPIDGHKTKIRFAADFIARADKIFTTKVITAVERQAYATLFANDRGVMIGSGEIWFSGICPDIQCSNPVIKIISIHP
jgi:hypothetical protein